MASSYEKGPKYLFGDPSGRMWDKPVEEPPKDDPAVVNHPRPPAKYIHQDLLDRMNNLVQNSIAHGHEAEQRRVEQERVEQERVEQERVEQERMAKSREYDPSPSPTPSVSTDDPKNDPSDAWHADQVLLNLVLNARNEYSLMPSTWQIALRGIPLPEGLFYAKTKNMATRPRIYALTEKLEFQGVQALRRLIDVHGRINDLQVKQAEVLGNNLRTPAERKDDEKAVIKDIARHLKKTLDEAIRWAAKDGKLDTYGDQLPANLTVLDLTSEEDAEKMGATIGNELNNLAFDWQETLGGLPGFGPGFIRDPHKPRTPVLFGFIIYKHVLFIATLNGSDDTALEQIPIQLNMGEKNQHQWNALAIMLTICWARDIQVKMAKAMKLVPEQEDQSSDPDA